MPQRQAVFLPHILHYSLNDVSSFDLSAGGKKPASYGGRKISDFLQGRDFFFTISTRRAQPVGVDIAESHIRDMFSTAAAFDSLANRKELISY